MGVKVAGDIYERIREEIVSGALPAGAPLVEAALAGAYGISRTPVREALRRLEHDGLVERADRSLRVRTRSPEEILEIYEVRIVLEGAAARAAAERRTELDLARLRTALRDLTAAPAVPAEMAAANRRFHDVTWAASHNAALIDVLSRLQSHLTRYPTTTLTYEGRWQAVIKDYDDLLDAIARRDGGQAARIAEEHMTAARDIRLQMYAADSLLS
ncbi:GntR family transcriptional regulator [Nonomuraea sp. NPDC050404]|uniref:GntR family transcriptional regulator n=1 Tax=Nonomuraea sp. NPDC050404 TaxID=3155783 RepID=UPI0033C7D872